MQLLSKIHHTNVDALSRPPLDNSIEMPQDVLAILVVQGNEDSSKELDPFYNFLHHFTPCYIKIFLILIIFTPNSA